MRTRTSVVLVALLALLGTALLSTPAQAAPKSPSPGCKGVMNALGKANAHAAPALGRVAAKLGCTSEPPPPVDPIACPDGTSAIATWAFVPGAGETPNMYGATKGTWSLLSGSAATGPTYAEENGGGYWASDVPVAGWVLESMTGEIVSVANSGETFNQNVFADRTGIKTVRFCG